MRIALLTNYLADYRLPLYSRLAETHGLEVLCFGGGENYVPAWFADLDDQLARAPFPATRIDGPRGAFEAAGRYDAVIVPFAGGASLPAAYAGARARRRAFVLWASIWQQPRSAKHLLALPATRHIHRHADAVIAYGEHVKRFVAGIRGHDDDIFVAKQAVEPELFGRVVSAEEIASFRAEHGLGEGPIVLYVGRLVEAKGIEVLLQAWREALLDATLVLIGDGPLAGHADGVSGTRLLGPLARTDLPVAYAAATVATLPSVVTPRFVEPWGLVCNEAMHQGTAVVVTDAVGAAAGGLVRDGQTGLVVPAGDPGALAGALRRALSDQPLRERLGDAGHAEVAGYNYDAMAEAFDRALRVASRE